ncbi:unnamed protein product [Blumeria hordei]|uniref:F-box domain-containing protein n=2 Tax=Blumeria hordei TaxID=2867405 RepID=A0A383UP43_BLUHO|nr:hypothetical protein BGHDH14_bghG003198000002001 [Blumeria hordei DH14]SZF01120.1 unnamed protein product [Blumeria hordei]
MPRTVPLDFFDLPAEIRCQIYRHAVKKSDSPILLTAQQGEFHNLSIPSNLFLTCSLIYHEVRPLYYSFNSFIITLDRINDNFQYLLQPQCREGLRMIRELRVVIRRWGKKDFFIHNFIPLMEDCILNGNLRELEVIFKENWVSKFKRGGGKDGKTWKSLKKLLLDPSLQKVRLLSWEGLGTEHLSRELVHMTNVRWLLDDPDMKNIAGTNVNSNSRNASRFQNQ